MRARDLLDYGCLSVAIHRCGFTRLVPDEGGNWLCPPAHTHTHTMIFVYDSVFVWCMYFILRVGLCRSSGGAYQHSSVVLRLRIRASQTARHTYLS